MKAISRGWSVAILCGALLSGCGTTASSPSASPFRLHLSLEVLGTAIPPPSLLDCPLTLTRAGVNPARSSVLDGWVSLPLLPKTWRIGDFMSAAPLIAEGPLQHRDFDAVDLRSEPPNCQPALTSHLEWRAVWPPATHAVPGTTVTFQALLSERDDETWQLFAVGAQVDTDESD